MDRKQEDREHIKDASREEEYNKGDLGVEGVRPKGAGHGSVVGVLPPCKKLRGTAGTPVVFRMTNNEGMAVNSIVNQMEGVKKVTKGRQWSMWYHQIVQSRFCIIGRDERTLMTVRP